ncbi:hypothetical protein AALB16_15460 [Lachnospiraceae bacterium 62-35]
MTKPTDRELSKALNILAAAGQSLSSQQICKLSDRQKNEYKLLLDEFERLNKISKNSPDALSNLHNLKGAALEDLVKYLLKISGSIFKVDYNLRTSTNEIDDLITLTTTGKILLGHNLINKRFDNFLGECKNYHKFVGVTYIGKFCSLLLTNNVKLGILFSYHGISGNGWSNGSGLVKKFYLHKENLDERFCIIDFSYKDFKSIYEGKNLLEIIEEQLCSLQFDTDYSRHISKHPAE